MYFRKLPASYYCRGAENGLDSVIGEGGLKLSGGEKQRISIARALLRKPHLFILMKPLPHQSPDRRRHHQYHQGYFIGEGQITILIAHRLSTIMHADCIYVLEQGVAETGSHQSLLMKRIVLCHGRQYKW